MTTSNRASSPHQAMVTPLALVPLVATLATLATLARHPRHTPRVHLRLQLRAPGLSFLLWQAIFAPLPAAFASPLADAPLDLCASPGTFAARRRSLLTPLLARVAAGDAPAMLATSHATHHGQLCVGLEWGRHGLPLLQAAARALGGRIVAAVCRHPARHDYLHPTTPPTPAPPSPVSTRHLRYVGLSAPRARLRLLQPRRARPAPARCGAQPTTRDTYYTHLPAILSPPTCCCLHAQRSSVSHPPTPHPYHRPPRRRVRAWSRSRVPATGLATGNASGSMCCCATAPTSPSATSSAEGVTIKILLVSAYFWGYFCTCHETEPQSLL